MFLLRWGWNISTPYPSSSYWAVPASIKLVVMEPGTYNKLCCQSPCHYHHHHHSNLLDENDNSWYCTTAAKLSLKYNKAWYAAPNSCRLKTIAAGLTPTVVLGCWSIFWDLSFPQNAWIVFWSVLRQQPVLFYTVSGASSACTNIVVVVSAVVVVIIVAAFVDAIVAAAAAVAAAAPPPLLYCCCRHIQGNYYHSLLFLILRRAWIVNGWNSFIHCTWLCRKDPPTWSFPSVAAARTKRTATIVLAFIVVTAAVPRSFIAGTCNFFLLLLFVRLQHLIIISWFSNLRCLLLLHWRREKAQFLQYCFPLTPRREQKVKTSSYPYNIDYFIDVLSIYHSRYYITCRKLHKLLPPTWLRTVRTEVQQVQFIYPTNIERKKRISQVQPIDRSDPSYKYVVMLFCPSKAQIINQRRVNVWE